MLNACFEPVVIVFCCVIIRTTSNVCEVFVDTRPSLPRPRISDSGRLNSLYKLIFGGVPFVLNINQSDNLKEYTPGYHLPTVRVRSYVVGKFDSSLKLSVCIFSYNMNVDENGTYIFRIYDII